MAKLVLRQLVRGFQVLLAAGALSSPTLASDVVVVEEQWALDVGGPDVDRSAPQVSMAISATGDVASDFFVLTLNHWSYPDFAAGGVQAQHWRGEACLATANATPTSSLHHDGETVRWAQRMTLDGCKLVFEVSDASSESWGDFAGNGALRLETSTDLDRLNAYRPAVSITESGIAYAGNRVSSLVLERIRWRFDEEEDDEWHEMVAPIDIDSDLDP